MHADALEHDVDEDLPHGHDDERVCPASGVAAVAFEKRPAKDDERDGGDEGQHRSDGRHGEGEREVGANQRAFLSNGESVQDDSEVRAISGSAMNAVEVRKAPRTRG